MKLEILLNNINKEDISSCGYENISDIEVDDIAYDSRKATANTIFVAINGETVDGHDYIVKASENGCRIFVVDKNSTKIDGLKDVLEDYVFVKVEDTRRALSMLSSTFFGNPSSKLKVIGVTGTKGKTTITNYIKTVLTSSGMNTGVIGTNGVFYNDVSKKTINTTPESYELHKTMREMLDNGVECVSMEVSSSGLMMKRVDDIEFDIGIYTNLSPDHIGPKEHKSFEDYRECKSRLFKLCNHGIVNIDDENSQYILKNSTCEILTFSIKNDSDIKASNIVLTRDSNILGSKFDYTDGDEVKSIEICSPGEFSIYNALAVISVCKYLNIDESKMKKSLSIAKVDGRVEVLPVLPYATVVVDYAHNGMSLENVLTTLKKYSPNRIIIVFGSIGGRAALRRKELGDIASKMCDIAVITTDNPDFEDPMKIIDEIEESFVNSTCKVFKEVDRSLAIYKALEIAESGDMVLITGKGHEKYQLIKGERVFFDEKQEIINGAKKVLENKK